MTFHEMTRYEGGGRRDGERERDDAREIGREPERDNMR
jgi:hypothetical protein